MRDAARSIRAGHLVTGGPDGPDASYVPLLISDDAATVTGHVARANPQWGRADVSVPALVTWVGPSAYVSPSSYPSKEEHGKVVPTWNYVAVQARGTLVVHEDDAWTRTLVRALTEFHERARPTPWSVDDAPDEYIERMVRAVVGIEVRVSSLEGVWKLSQNKGAADAAGVVADLRGSERGSPEAAVVRLMEERGA
jgi:transcriptional regulator